LVQDAHEAIRPTGTHRTPDLVARYVEPDEAKLYRLIYDRALASLMSDKLEEQTTALFGANGLSFKATGTFGPCSKATKRSMAISKMTTPSFCPRSNRAKPMRRESRPEQKYTKAPARYSEAKVVKMMEEKGIGRPSTYASTIKTLIDPWLCHLQRRHYHPDRDRFADHFGSQ
jgi:DNA topoisomerase-1